MTERLAALAQMPPGFDSATVPVVLALGALVIVLVATSNRMLRQLHGFVAHSLYHLGLGAGREGHLSTLQSARSAQDFVEALPWVTCRVAGVTPVTLFLLQGDQFIPTHSTRAEVESAPVSADDPLAHTMNRSGWVHDLRGRADDLENAPIHAVNRSQVEECRALCAVPLRTRGTLHGFLLCGGSQGYSRLSMTSMAWLQALGRIYSSYLGRFEAAYAVAEEASFAPAATMVNPTLEVVGVKAVAPVLRSAPYLESSGSTVAHSTDVGGVEPRMAGYRGGYETAD